MSALARGSRPWPDERIATLKRLHAAGRIISDIAVELGLTQASVARKAHRLGLQAIKRPVATKHPRPAPQRRLPPPAKPAVAPAPPPPKPKPAPAEAPVPRQPEPALAKRPVFGAAAAVMALQTRQCCWPLGEPFDQSFRFCAAPASHPTNPDNARFYCVEHHEMRASRGTPSERAADRPPMPRRPPDWRTSL